VRRLRQRACRRHGGTATKSAKAAQYHNQPLARSHVQRRLPACVRALVQRQRVGKPSSRISRANRAVAHVMTVYWLAAKNYSSVRYAYVWCEKLAGWDPTMGGDIDDMRTLYREYAAQARHLGHVVGKFQHTDNIIRPVHFNTWYEIFCRVFSAQ
jgi:hypothetical protein